MEKNELEKAADKLNRLAGAQAYLEDKEVEKLAKRKPQELTLEDFLDQMQQMMKKFTGGNSKMSLRKARKNLAGMNFDKLTGKGGGNIPKF